MDFKMKKSRKLWAYVALAVAAIFIAELLLSHAHAAANQYAVLQPADVDWQQNDSVRVCAVEAPTGDATITPPTATAYTQTADSEGCFHLELGESGSWTVSWPVAGPATRTIGFQVSGPVAVDYDFWLQFLTYAVVIIGSLYMGWMFAAGFAVTGSFSLWLDAWPFDLEFTMVFVLFGILAQFVADAFQWKRKGTVTNG